MINVVAYSRPRLDLGVALEEYPIGGGGYIADEALPAIGVQKKEASLPVVTRESILRPVEVARSKGSGYGRDGFQTDELSYKCEEYGLEGKLDEEDISFYSSAFDAEMITSALTRDRLAREREKRVAAALFNTSTFTGASLFTDLSTDWDNIASLPVNDVNDAKEKVRSNCGRDANTMIIAAPVLNWLKKNTDLKARLSGVMALYDNTIPAALAAIFGIERVLIAGAVYGAPEGDTFSATDIWSDNYCWIGVLPRTSNIAEPCVGRTLLWSPDSPTLYTVEQYAEPQTRSQIYRVRHHLQEKIWDANYGHLLQIDT